MGAEINIKTEFEFSKVPTREVKELNFIGGKKHISATVDKSTNNIIKVFLKKSRFRNKSHVIEEAIKVMGERE